MLEDMGDFLLLMGSFVIKTKPNECLGSSLGRPLALPPQPQLVPGGFQLCNPTGALAAPWGPLVLPASFQNPVDALTHLWGGLGFPPPRLGTLGEVWVPPGPLGGCGVV